MAVGLQVWDANGNLVVDITDRLSKILGTVYTGSSNGSVTVSGLSEGEPFCTACPIAVQGGNLFNLIPPRITINKEANTVSWQFTSTFQSASYLVLGGY